MSIISSKDHIFPGLEVHPADCRTEKQWLRSEYRISDKPVGVREFTADKPRYTHRKSASPLTTEELLEFCKLESRGETPIHLEEALRRSGQRFAANLYTINQVEKIETPTESEARQLVEWLLRDPFGYHEGIVKFWDRNKGKDTWTWGTGWAGPDDKTPTWDDHLWGGYYSLGAYVPVKKGPLKSSKWIAIDIDRHSGLIPWKLHQAQVRDVFKYLTGLGYKVVVSINPRNGSTQLWVYIPDGDYQPVVADLRVRFPWLNEILPDNKPQMIFPLRPDKLVICDGLLPKVKMKRKAGTGRRYKGERQFRSKPVYSCAAFWTWFKKGQNANWETVEKYLQAACLNTPDTTEPDPLPEDDHDKKPRTKSQKPRKLVRTGQGSLRRMKGRYLQTLVSVYVQGERPPEDTLGILEAMIVRHAAVKGLPADEIRALIKRLRTMIPDKSFSDRLTFNEAELDRSLEYLLADPFRYQPDPEQSKAIWGKVEAYCKEIGFDLTDTSTWKLKKISARLVKNEFIESLTAKVALNQRCAYATAERLLHILANHVEVKGETANSYVKKFLIQVGIPGTNDRAVSLMGLLKVEGFLFTVRNHFYDRASGCRVGAFYCLGASVRFEEESPFREGEKKGGVSTALSFFSSFLDPDWEVELLLERRRVNCEIRYSNRLRWVLSQKMRCAA